MQYNEPSICPICGTKTIVAIQAYGDYDGPDHAHETDPCNCLTCKGIEMTNAEMWNRLSSLYNKLLKERDRYKKEAEKQRKDSYSCYELYQPLHGTNREDSYKLFMKRFTYFAEIYKSVHGKEASVHDEWVVGNAVHNVGQAFLWAVEKRKGKAHYPY